MTKECNYVLQKFFELALRAEQIASEMVEPVDHALDAVLLHVLSHPELRQEFGHAFLQVARDPSKGPAELVEYCMHTLRWPEVRKELSAWLEAESSERVRHILRGLLMAFEDDWRHSNLYARYRKKE
jgi:hypothetical protein